MPLTEEEQAELNSLKTARDAETSQPAAGLSQEENSELRQLKQQRADEQSQLVDQLGGRLPPTPEVITQMSKTPAGAKFLQGELGRRQAFEQLENRGFTRDQLDLTLRANKQIGRPRIGRTAGGLGGAIAATAIGGRLIPGPIDDAAIIAALVGGAGAGVGGAAGEAAQIGLEEKRLISTREALNAFAIEAGMELGGRAVVGAGKLLIDPLIKKTVPAAAALVDDFAKVGGTFSPSELDSRFSIKIAESFSRGSFGAKDIFQEFEEKQGRAVLAFADNIIEGIGEGVARQTPEEIGAMFAEGITRPNGRVLTLLDDLFSPLYSQIDELGAGATVSTKGLKSFAVEQIARDNRINKQFLSPAGRSKLQKVIGLSDNVSFSDMRTLRSSYLKDVRKLARDVDQSQGIIKRLASITDDAIFDPKAAKGLSTEATNLLRNTNRLYKTSQDALKNTFSEKLAKRLLRNPSGVAKEVFPNNNPEAIRFLRESLIEPISGKKSAEGKVLWNQLRQAWLADAVGEATKEGVAKPNVLSNIFRKMGDKGLKEMFPDRQTLAGIKKIQSAFEIAGKSPPSGTSLFSRSVQVGGVLAMAKGYKDGDFIGFTTGSVLALGPLAFAKLATNPRGVKLITSGLKLRPGASGLVPTAARMVKLRQQINNIENRKLKTSKRLKEIERKGVSTMNLQPFPGISGLQ